MFHPPTGAAQQFLEFKYTRAFFKVAVTLVAKSESLIYKLMADWYLFPDGIVSFTSFCSSSSSSSSSSLALSLQCSATTCSAWCLRSSSPATAFPPSLNKHLSKGKQKANAVAERRKADESAEADPRTWVGTVREWRIERTRLVADKRFSSHHSGVMLHMGLRSLSIKYPTVSADNKDRKQKMLAEKIYRLFVGIPMLQIH